MVTKVSSGFNSGPLASRRLDLRSSCPGRWQRIRRSYNGLGHLQHRDPFFSDDVGEPAVHLGFVTHSFSPTPPYHQTSSAPSSGVRSGRHSGTGTSPGSTMSRPSKNRANSFSVRGTPCWLADS